MGMCSTIKHFQAYRRAPTWRKAAHTVGARVLAVPGGRPRSPGPPVARLHHVGSLLSKAPSRWDSSLAGEPGFDIVRRCSQFH